MNSLKFCNAKVSTLTCTFQITGTTQEDLHKQYEAEAESRTKTNLVIEAVAFKAEGSTLQKKKSKKKSSTSSRLQHGSCTSTKLLSADMLKHDITIKSC